MKLSRLYAATALLCVCASLLLTRPAFADTAVLAPIIAPWGAWTIAILDIFKDIIVTAAVGVTAYFVPAIFRQFLTDRLLTNAVNYAIAAISGAVHGKTVALPQVNSLVTMAEAYAVANASWLVKWLGDTLRPKILARLGAAGVVPAEANAATAGAVLALPGKR